MNACLQMCMMAKLDKIEGNRNDTLARLDRLDSKLDGIINFMQQHAILHVLRNKAINRFRFNNHP